MSIAGRRQTTVSKVFTGSALMLVGALALTGCSAGPQATTTPSAQSTSSASEKSTKTPQPTASSSPSAFALKSESMDKTCESVLSLQSLYDFDPNLALTPGGTPAAGSPAQSQIQLGGISCTLTNLSSQQEVLVTVVKLDQASTDHQKAEIASATGNNSFQVASEVPGSFYQAGGVGTAQFVTGHYWISLTSASYKIAVEASPLSYVIWNNLQ